MLVVFVLFNPRFVLNFTKHTSLLSFASGYPARDLNGERHTGFSIAQTTNRNGSRLSVARAFLRPVKNRQNLHVMLNATVTKILINQTTRQAYAVEVRNSFGGTEVIFANNEIVLR